MRFLYQLTVVCVFMVGVGKTSAHDKVINYSERNRNTTIDRIGNLTQIGIKTDYLQRRIKTAPQLLRRICRFQVSPIGNDPNTYWPITLHRSVTELKIPFNTKNRIQY